MTERTNSNEIHLHFNKSYVNHHRYGLIGLFIGGLIFGFISFFASPFHDLTHPIGLFSFVYFLLIFVFIAGFLASRLRFMSTGSPALILSEQGITDNSSIISKGFFIPYSDILSVKAAMLGRRGYYKDLETGEENYPGLWSPRTRMSDFASWGRGPNSNLMLMTGGKTAAYSISLQLANREKYVPKRNSPIYHDGEGLIYNIFCSPIDIPVLELKRLIEEGTRRHYSPREEDEYEAKLRELRRGGD
jgi:hypothetical protein